MTKLVALLCDKAGGFIMTVTKLVALLRDKAGGFIM